MATNDDIPDPLGSDAPPTHQQPLPPISKPLDYLPPPRPKYDAQSAATPDPADVDDEVPQSQPMTATHSNSSQNGDGDASAPYGTRSRNRGPRINYADDKELDLEIELPGLPEFHDTYEWLLGHQRCSNFEWRSCSSAKGSCVPATQAKVPAPTPAPAPSKKRKQPPASSAAASGTTTPFALGPQMHAQPAHYVVSNVMSFSKSEARLNAKDQLIADDGTTLAANEHAYFICEPPGDPYYLARIMEFLHANNDPAAPVDAIRVNWYYRPKDIGRRVQDTRCVIASMHSDTCPIASLRGKCNIQHLNDIDNLETYRKQKDSFWFDKLYDRYMHRYYEVIPTSKVVNVPQRVKDVLDERWKFVLIEVGRSRDLTSASKRCIRCEQFAANNDSVDCAVCKNTYHMRCVRPALARKPARGFAWACAACSRKQDLMLEARNTPTLSESAQTPDEEMVDEEDSDNLAPPNETRESSAMPEEHPPPTAAQLAQANLWPWRYLGVHSRVEDALDYDDRIYPRASSRLGPRHQANVNIWHGRPVELVKPADIKKKYQKSAGSKKDGKMSKETLAQLEAERDQRQKRPKWVLDEPVGYIARGHDEAVEVRGKKEHTAQVIFKMPESGSSSGRGLEDAQKPTVTEAEIDEYIAQVKKLAGQYDVQTTSVDLLTKAIEKLQANDYDAEKALAAMRGLSKRTDLKMPDLNREEVKRFEEGVGKYGSELHLVARHVGTVKEARIVRFYYMWKKTDRGRQIWGSFEGRKSKKDSKKADKGADGKVEDVADDGDDSAYDNAKAAAKKRGFECKFCATRHSRQWRRAPNTSPGTLVPADSASKNSKDKSNWLLLALCGKCAYLWRRYAIQYENIEEISKKIAAAGGRAAKRKIDEELLQIHYEAHSAAGDPISMQTANEVHKAGVEIPQSIIQYDEPPKKKTKGDKDAAIPSGVAPDIVVEKKKPAEKVPEAPLEPEAPRVKVHPCAVCHVIECPGQELLKCRDCRLHVHGVCYGVSPTANVKPWFCDMCRNDQILQVSTIYECLLCPVTYTHQELMEPLRISHKKKSDREREKERVEREMVAEASRRWRQQQEAAGRPVNPREALKRTAWNNWTHIVCALWTPEIKFGDAELLDAAEGVGYIPPERYEGVCKICKTSGKKPVHTCHQPGCNATFHIGCAHQANYIFGFDITPVKGSRRDSVQTVKFGNEGGLAVPAIWCASHGATTFVHSMVEQTEDGQIALQVFARKYKQADTSITGTVRRAQQFNLSAPLAAQPTQQPARQPTITNGASSSGPERTTRRRRGSRSPSPNADPDEMEVDGPDAGHESTDTDPSKRKCCSCLVEVSPKWWPVQQPVAGRSVTPPPARENHPEQPHVNGIVASPQVESSSSHAPGEVITNGIVKHEPKEPENPNATPQAPGEMWQCHKCHVGKVAPPSSPSQVRPRPRTAAEPESDPIAEAPAFTSSSAYPFAPPRPPPLEGPLTPHAHPAVAPPVPAHHSPWGHTNAPWPPPAPFMRDPGEVANRYGPRPPPPAGYPHQPSWDSPLERSSSQIHYGPPPTAAAGHHSPPTAGYGVPPPPPGPPLPLGPAPTRAPSPPRYDAGFAGLGIGGPPMRPGHSQIREDHRSMATVHHPHRAHHQLRVGQSLGQSLSRQRVHHRSTHKRNR
ncbi:Lid2 complex component snt2 [Cyphellophora attinorum]|uniref:Lid2 complex component snt2 n=1 Tax=Cyphellophora attinorum TaxID=1664694 RepID=A0A0N1H2M4_9EURO|nr:Lid2 complex component snt2 [Phialophora attinorum]KPI38784.1 Lid2 complex component snt2 [Phialophora attinorum]